MKSGISVIFALLALPVAAQTYPSRTVRIIVPFAVGGTIDVVARVMGQEMAKSMGRPFIAETRPGAGGAIGAELVAKAPPDGYTLLMGSPGSLTVNAVMNSKLPYDPLKDFTHITMVANLPFVLATHPSVPVRSAKELIALARTRAGQLNYGSSGNGSAAHYAGELFKIMAKVDIAHIPYKGSGPATTDLIAGQIDMYFGGISLLLPHAKSGRLKTLAMTTAKRSIYAPDLPTLGESAVPGYEAASWYGLVAPAGTPKDIVAKLVTEVHKTLTTPEMKDLLQNQGLEANTSTPEQMTAGVTAEITKMRSVFKAGTSTQ
jgi:tripartite-type tricarboxylate transporter receptor subunit TctC